MSTPNSTIHFFETQWVTDLVEIEDILNTVLNVRDAMPDGGTIDISLKQTDSQVEMRLADTGEGMDRNVKEKVFDPFSHEGSHSGHGVGPQHLLQYHQGPRRHDRDRYGKGNGDTVHHQDTGGGVKGAV